MLTIVILLFQEYKMPLRAVAWSSECVVRRCSPIVVYVCTATVPESSLSFFSSVCDSVPLCSEVFSDSVVECSEACSECSVVDNSEEVAEATAAVLASRCGCACAKEDPAAVARFSATAGAPAQ
ncbi:unnamed protein product [Acanthoscelides obtectus]|uniref:Uncharacterized protein n=1 Tax=Acanthoscelides obtectus TaxID=200917 RepID=A0A9P0PB59_ACAOB|nr:unnamed protein product [Acanthoscelides obtectus]CAK1656951.1 hypothetical protein AOBTE_LOCUS20037 [Acanthoscelides obtectus]